MGSNLLSRFLPPNPGSQSVYEVFKDQETGPVHSNSTDSAIDHRNLQEQFHDDDDLDRFLSEDTESQHTSQASPAPARAVASTSQPPYRDQDDQLPRPKWVNEGLARVDPAEDEDAVPDSLLIDDKSTPRPGPPDTRPTTRFPNDLPEPVPGPTARNISLRWDVPPTRRRTAYQNNRPRNDPSQQASPLVFANPYDKAMWRWTNVQNLDIFLRQAYAYFDGRGFWSIILSRVLHHTILAFVVGLGVFLTYCIDYSRLPGSKSMPDILIPKCTNQMSGPSNLLLWLFSFYWLAKLLQDILDVPRLWNLHDFYTYLLGISEDDLQTITWQTIVSRLMDLRDSNPKTAVNADPRHRKYIGENSKQRMDAHDIANRLMRRENYLIALFNKEILDLSLPLPFLHDRRLFSRHLESAINTCIVDFVFNEQGQVRHLFLKDSHRRELVEALQRRFLIVGFINVACAPFQFLYFLMILFLRYFTEFQKNPSQIGARTYTPLAEWKFREFNELPHFFDRRANMSMPFATRYLDQFPKEKTMQAARFVAFIAGALAAVLAAASLLDPDVFLGFDVTHDRTVLFYLGVLGTVWAVARGMVPEDNTVFDPEYAIREVMEFTHYFPAHWQGRLHGEEVRKEFAEMYQMKVFVFAEELISILLAPFVLWFSLPRCSERLVDFFREFTVHVDGIGYVCSFAVFDFQRGGARISAAGKGAAQDNGKQKGKTAGGLRDDYFATKDNKLLTSYYSFVDSYANPAHRPHLRRGGSFHRALPPEFPTLSASQQRPSGGLSRSRNAIGHSQLGEQPEDLEEEEEEEPAPSMLLDPMHQPAASHIARSAALNQPSSSTRNLSASRRSPRPHEHEGPSSSALIGADSNLADSWKTTRGSGGANNSSGGELPDPNRDAGVLGLLYQFQKATGEGARGKGMDV